MNLTDSDLAEFTQILREDYGVQLSHEEARKEEESMLNFARFILSSPKNPSIKK